MEFSPSSIKVRLISTGYFYLSFANHGICNPVSPFLLYSIFPRFSSYSLVLVPSVTLTSTPFFSLLAVEFNFTLQQFFSKLGRVDVPLTRHTPHGTGRAGFPHPALYKAD